MSKTIKISADFIQEMKGACDKNQLSILKKHVDAWDCTITEQGVKELYAVACNGWKEKFEIKFPEILKNNNPCAGINSEQDAYNKIGCNPDKDVINIDGFNEAQLNSLKGVIKKMRLCEAYNGVKALTRADKRHYSWYTLNSAGAGLVFNSSNYDDDSANLTSAACLSFKENKFVMDFVKKFKHVDEQIIGL